MKTILLFLLLSFFFVVNAGEPNDKDISLHKEGGVCNEEQHYGVGSSTSFSAQLITNNLVKVQSTDITTFEVRILEAEDNTVCYVGSTTHGILHITTSSLSAGHYILSIKGDGFKYVGEFVIGN